MVQEAGCQKPKNWKIWSFLRPNQTQLNFRNYHSFMRFFVWVNSELWQEMTNVTASEDPSFPRLQNVKNNMFSTTT